MSFFGDFDAETISTNPYRVEAGEYEGEITAIEVKKDRNDKRQLVITFTVDDENSEYHEKDQKKFLDLWDEDLDNEGLALLPAKERAEVKNNQSNLKRWLCGDDRHVGLGVSVASLNDPDWDFKKLQGTRVVFMVNNYGTDNEKSGVRWANIVE